MKAWMLSLAIVVAGCSSTGGAPQKAQLPVSQQPVTGETQVRAKNRVELAAAYFQAKQLSTALEEIRKAIAIDSRYAPAQNLLALIYMELGEQQLAEQAFERTLQLAPGDPEFSNNYGWFLCQTDRPQASIEQFKVAVNNPLYATPTIALVNAAVCAAKLNDDKAAEQYLRRALALEPGNGRALLQLSELEFRGARYGEAKLHLAELHRYIEPSAETLGLSLRIAKATGNRGDEARARSLLMQKFPDSPEARGVARGQ